MKPRSGTIVALLKDCQLKQRFEVEGLAEYTDTQQKGMLHESQRKEVAS
jgi:hypothetical protein